MLFLVFGLLCLAVLVFVVLRAIFRSVGRSESYNTVPSETYRTEDYSAPRTYIPVVLPIDTGSSRSSESNWTNSSSSDSSSSSSSSSDSSSSSSCGGSSDGGSFGGGDFGGGGSADSY